MVDVLLVVALLELDPEAMLGQLCQPGYVFEVVDDVDVFVCANDANPSVRRDPTAMIAMIATISKFLLVGRNHPFLEFVGVVAILDSPPVS